MKDSLSDMVLCYSSGMDDEDRATTQAATLDPEKRDVPSTRAIKHSRCFAVVFIVLVPLIGVSLWKALLPGREGCDSPISGTQNPDSLQEGIETRNYSDDTSNMNSLYYYTRMVDNGHATFSFYTFVSDLESPDQRVYEQTFAIDSDVQIIANRHYTNGVLEVSKREEGYTFDTLQLKPTTTITHLHVYNTKERAINDALYVQAQHMLFYVSSTQGFRGASNSVLHIVDLTHNNEEQTIVLKEGNSSLYGSFGFLEVSDDLQTIYLHESGGDAGMMWSHWYRVDRASGSVVELDGLPIFKGTFYGETLEKYAISPDGKKMVHLGYSHEGTAGAHLQDVGKFDEPSCLEYGYDISQNVDGGTITLVDLSTMTRRELFRNLSYADNYCQNVAREIRGLLWPDHNSILFETIDGVFLLDILSGSTTPLFIFKKFDESPALVERPGIIGFTLPHVLFDDGSVGHTGTQNILIKHDDSLAKYFIPTK